MKTLRTLHLYLGCIFAPILIFFAVSGLWQTMGWTLDDVPQAVNSPSTVNATEPPDVVATRVALSAPRGATAAAARRNADDTRFIRVRADKLDKLIELATNGPIVGMKDKAIPGSAQGMGAWDAPRGALAHWIVIENQKIANYQLVVPSTWNASPRDAKGQLSAYESSLVGTPIADPERPLEVLRTIHSFDPCLACAVHLYDEQGRTLNRITVG